MPGNSIGSVFRFTSFGESHGPAAGGVIDGCPAGLDLDFDFIQGELERRRLQYPGSTARKEPDILEWLSGLLDLTTLGTPLAFLVRNESQKPGDYDQFSEFYRPSHADYAYDNKYGIRDARGGGRASGRETVARVVAGSVAKLFLNRYGITIEGRVARVGPLQLTGSYQQINFGDTRGNEMRLADPAKNAEVVDLLEKTLAAGNTLGGSVACRISGVPPGLGEPVFDKLSADLAKSVMSIGSAKGFEYGMGFQAAGYPGSLYNDQMKHSRDGISFLSNHDGGIQGGISTGQDIFFNVAFKPVPSIRLPQEMISKDGRSGEIVISGRHDTCHVPRLVVVVEAMAALAVADHMLRNLSARIR